MVAIQYCHFQFDFTIILSFFMQICFWMFHDFRRLIFLLSKVNNSGCCQGKLDKISHVPPELNFQFFHNYGRKIASLYFLEFIIPGKKFDWGVRSHLFMDRDILLTVRNHMKDDMGLSNQSVMMYLKSIVTFLKVLLKSA
jgi:hypothetical protein